MAKQPDITVVSSGFYSTATINANFEALQEAFDNVISRDGSTPNTMLADLDMNSNDILNASAVYSGRFYRNGVEMVPTGLTSVEYAQYTEGSTGTVSRDVPDRLRDFVTVADFGGDPSNSSGDNTTYFQAAIDSGKSPIFVPYGNYAVSVGSLTGIDRADGAYFLGLGSTINSLDQKHSLRGWFFGNDGVYAENYDIWLNDGFSTGVNDTLTSSLLTATAETEDVSPLDGNKSKVPINVTVRARGAQHASGIRSNLVNYSTDGNGCTAFYGHIETDTASNWSAALHGESRHAGGTSICLSVEAASYSNTGSFYGAVINNTSAGAPASIPHPITGASTVTHSSATGLLFSGTAGSDKGEWLYGIRFRDGALRAATGEAIRFEDAAKYQLRGTSAAVSATADILLEANSNTGVILNGTYTTGVALRLKGGQALAWEATNTAKTYFDSTTARLHFRFSSTDRISLEIDPTPRILINGTQVLQERDTGWTAMSGTATKGGFDTATVTLGQLAQVVKAMLDSDIGHGFKGA